MCFNSKKGFTLVELLISVTILAIIISMSLSIINYAEQRNMALANNTHTAFISIETALNTYKEARGSYPDKDTSCTTYPVDVKESCLPNFIPSFLLAPPKVSVMGDWLTSDYYQYDYDNSTGNTYLFIKSKDPLKPEQLEIFQRIQSQEGEGKVIISPDCGEVTDNIDNSSALCLTWWIQRH